MVWLCIATKVGKMVVYVCHQISCTATIPQLVPDTASLLAHRTRFLLFESAIMALVKNVIHIKVDTIFLAPQDFSESFLHYLGVLESLGI